jgi:hypothetical protein
MIGKVSSKDLKSLTVQDKRSGATGFRHFEPRVIEVSPKKCYLVLLCDNHYVFIFTTTKLEELDFNADASNYYLETIRYGMLIFFFG